MSDDMRSPQIDRYVATVEWLKVGYPGAYEGRLVDRLTELSLPCPHVHRTAPSAWRCAYKMLRAKLREAPDAG